MAAKGSADINGMWTPYKELLSIVEVVIGHNKVEYIFDLEKYLVTYRPAVIALLENPRRSTKQREELKKAPEDGIQIDGTHGTTKLSESFVTEALAFSDALNLSEFSCVDLLVSAEQQMSNFPGLSRGLVAALLYHDGRRCLVTALKLLITAKDGISWALDVDEQTTTLVNQYTSNLFNDGLIGKILQKLNEINVQTQLDTLEKCKAVGDGKHRKQLTGLINELRNSLADCLFCWACQAPLGRRDTLVVIDFLKDCVPSTSDGSYDHVTLKVVMAVLVSWCTTGYETFVDDILAVEDDRFPVFQDTDFIMDIHKEVIRPDIQHWRTPSIKAILQFGWAVFLRFLSQITSLEQHADVFEEDDDLMNGAIDCDAFRVMRTGLIAAETFPHEEHCIRTIHALITSLIVHFPLKVKDLRSRGDENARIQQVRLMEGLDVTKGIRHDFEDLMLLIGDLYKKDPLDLELNIEYWCPNEPFGLAFSPRPVALQKQSVLHRQILLNKFVRLAGDLIPQTMFNSYIKMLTGLSINEQGAQYCFNLLSSDGSIGRSSTCSATWDHFFQSFKQYYASLKQDVHSTDHLAHVHHHHNISPEELAALECVLELITTLSEHNENVRIAFCDNKQWLPIASFFGLIGCPVPSTLKASLLNALAAFARSPEISMVIWQSLEATQILSTRTKDQSSKQETGIKVELEETEARDECYPQTRAFLRLLNRLIDITIPSTLGAGFRVPGFSPYLEFLRDNVFLRFKDRAYQDSSEKWMVASSVLEIFVKILASYEPLSEHLQDHDVEIQGVRFGKAAKPPGYELMLHLLNDTPMFRLVMYIIDFLGKELDDSILGKASSEEQSVLYCLKLIEHCLEKQTTLLSLLRDGNSAVLITPMDKLLLSINPNSAEADYPYKIARCITLNSVDPELSLSVVRILLQLSESSDVQNEIIVNLASKKIEREQLLVGFCEFLEHELPEEVSKEKTEQGDQDDASHFSGSAVRNSIRQNIVNLLLATLQQPSPNLAQYLLGFDLQRSISKTVLQDAGVGRFPKTCFHSIISLLNRGTDSSNGPACISETPKLAELMYQLVYFLCAHPETGIPCQRYLRTSHDFFVTHASNLPFVRPHLLEDGNNEVFVLLSNQQSWLLKTLAIETKMASQTRLRSSIVRILDVLYGQRSIKSNDFTESLWDKQTDMQHNVISMILADLELTQIYPSPFESNIFDVSAIEHLLSTCDERSESTGVIICDIKRLHRKIMVELNSAQGMSFVGQRPEILKEVENILRYAVERNMVRRSLGAKRHAFEAWRQVVETTFAICHYEVFTGDRREAVILNLLQEMLAKTTDERAIPELISPVAGAILMLMSQYHNIVGQRAIPSADSDPVVVVDMAPLLKIFQSIISCLCSTGASYWKTRCSLYGAILYYMQIGKLQTSVYERAASDMFVTTSKESWEANTLSVISRDGDQFMDMLCRDACDGPEIGEMLAFAVLDSLVSIDWQERWSGFLSSRGYIRHLVESISEDDGKLLTVLLSDADALKTVYSLESKLSFLAKFSKSEIGAQILLQSGLVSKLVACQFLDYRPDESNIALQLSKLAYSQQYDPLSPTKLEQYRVIFLAILRLLQAILSSLGPTHNYCLLQIQQIVMAHEEVFLTILQSNTSYKTLASLRELSVVTSVVCLLRPRYNDPEGVTDENKKSRGFLAKLQRILLGLMQTFTSKAVCDQIIKHCIEAESNEHMGEDVPPTSEISIANIKRTVLQIRSNLIGYARGVVSSSGLTGAYCNVIFSPSFIDVAVTRKTHDDALRPADARKIPMGVLVEELDHAAEDLIIAANNMKKYSRRMNEIEDMAAEEIVQLLTQELVEDSDRLSNQQRRILTQKVIQQLLDLNDDQACLNIQIIENMLYLLWRHIEYYFVHCEPVDVGDVPLNLSKPPTIRARRLQDITLQAGDSDKQGKSNMSINIEKYNVSRGQIEQLQVEAKTVLTEKLLKKVIETEAIYGKTRSKFGFISAMVRRIQGLITLYSSR